MVIVLVAAAQEGWCAVSDAEGGEGGEGGGGGGGEGRRD